MSTSSHRSQRFTKAATSERNRLIRRRRQLSSKLDDLQGRVLAIETELSAVDDEIRILQDFATEKQEDGRPRPQPSGFKGTSKAIRGATIRRLAVPLLLRERGPGPVHYVEWASLLEAQGFRVEGKRPDAVFLNQVSRSPLVRATTKAGFYELDLEAPDRLEDRLRQQKTKLATLMIESPKDARDFDRHRRVQAELHASIRKAERELSEARTVLAESLPSRAQIDARAA
jgi:chromosome segregation ATPase